MTKSEITELICDVLRHTNLGREPDQQLLVSADAPLYAPGSPLDSLGLVAFLIDVEEALLDQGLEISLNSEQAMSQTRSPFRSVPALADFIHDNTGR